MNRIECSMNSIPYTELQRAKVGIPLYFVYTPLCNEVNRYDIPTISRCRGCKGYMNKYNNWIVAGRTWKCCLCGHINTELTERYLQLTQERIQEYPELIVDALEIKTDSNYTRRPMQGNCILFAIDQLYFESVKDILINIIQKIPNNTRIGVMIYSDKITLFKYHNSHYSIDVFSEDAIELINDINLYLSSIETIKSEIIDNIRKYNDEQNYVGCCFGNAMKTINFLLKNYGGKVICLNGSHPTKGEGKLNPLTNDFKTFKSSHDPFYDELAIEMNNNMITIDMFFNLRNAFDTATLSDFARRTGGRVYVCNSNEELFQTMINDILQSYRHEAVFRIRSTHNLATKKRYGNYNLRNNDLIAVPCIDPTSCFVIDYEILPISNITNTYIQTVFLYTNQNKERMLRIETMKIPQNSQPEINARGLTIACNIISSTIGIKEGLKEAKEYLINIAKKIPKYCSQRNEAIYYLYCLTKTPQMNKKGYVCAGILRTIIGKGEFPIPVMYVIDGNGNYRSVTLSGQEVKNCLVLLIIGEQMIIGVDRLLEKKMIKSCFGVSTITEIANNSLISEEDNVIAITMRKLISSIGKKIITIDCSDRWKEWLIVEDNYHDGWTYQKFLNIL
ncbi:EhSec24A, putative [Entamoeba histolytica KU27]|uniref:EhSec24A, putative n=1 Tax=Entamoeba histolytica KU27 TaxID=885311 RepID=M2RYW6_ENTHI|nr:EhSec24A, putative [Entamoeba histolytica KU27]